MVNNSRKSILVVDDEDICRESLQDLLEDHGFLCKSAVNGSWAYAELMMTHVDLVIADYDMPKLNGLQLLEYMKEHSCFQTTPFILITGKLDPKIGDTAQLLGASATFTKPYNSEDLLAIVTQLLSCQNPS